MPNLSAGLLGIPEDAAIEAYLTLEYAPPESSGGKAIALTCRKCNSAAGAALDHEMQQFGQMSGFTRSSETGSHRPASGSR
jgi:hypothetical protein